MRTIKLAFVFLLAALALPGTAFAAESTSVRAILVVASNEKGGTDPKLASHEENLRRVLRFQSYRAVGEGSTSVRAGQKASISLPGGNRVDLQASPTGQITVAWGGATVPLGDRTVVLGGRPANDKGDVYAMIVTRN